MLGLEPDQLKTPQDWVNRIHEDDVASYRAALIAHFRGETPRFEREFRYRGGSGDWRWARQHGIARFNESGRAVRMIGATGDVTGLKRAEIALRESDERYALATEAATEGLYDWNVISDRLVVSERLNAIMQMQSGILSSMEWNERVHPGDRAKYRAAMRAHFRGETRTCRASIGRARELANIYGSPTTRHRYATQKGA